MCFFSHNHNLWSCQKVCDALVYLLDNIYIRFGTKLYRQTIGIPMGTNCVPLVADMFLFCYERDFLKSPFTWKSDWHYWGFQFNFKILWWFIMPPTSLLGSITLLMHSMTLEPWMLLFWNFLYGFLMKKIADKLWPFEKIWMQSCRQNISKTIEARAMK